MATPIVNGGLVTVNGTYNAAATTITLQTGEGSKLSVTTGGYRYPVVWWNATNYAHPADDPFWEIILVTNRSGDVLTVVRGQEFTTASAKNTPGVTYRMLQGLTAGMVDELRVTRNTHQGLVLQTHRDASDALRKVEITACEYLVMDDGTVSRNDNGEWTGQAADITVSGAGGLDVGTEEVGTWYEIYGIAKEDGTRKLILMKSKGWFNDTNFSSGGDQWQGVRPTTANTMLAQGFRLSGSGRVVYADLRLRRVGSPVGNLWVELRADNAGVPGAVLATSHRVDVAKLSAVGDNSIRFTFPSTDPFLSSTPTQYHVSCAGDWAIDGLNYIQWRADSTAGTYTGGAKSSWNGTVWTADADDDLYFSIGTEQYVQTLVRPAEYTKQCFLGWVFNDGSGNFVPFVQQGRRRRTTVLSFANCSVGALNGTEQILELQVVVPPLESCTVLMGVGGTGTAAGVVAVGDLSALNVSSIGDSAGAQSILYSGMTSTRPGVFTEVIVRRNACMAHGTSGATVWVSGFSW